MPKAYSELTEVERYRLAMGAAKKTFVGWGYELKKMPGRGQSATYVYIADGSRKKVAIKTSGNRWFAFSPLDGGKHWKTLDDVDQVLVVAVDTPKSPTAFHIYLFPVEEVREAFRRGLRGARRRRAQGGRQLRHVGLLGPDRLRSAHRRRRRARRGIQLEGPAFDCRPPRFPKEGPAASSPPSDAHAQLDPPETFATIGEVMAWARQRIANLAGVPVDAVNLGLSIQG